MRRRFQTTMIRIESWSLLLRALYGFSYFVVFVAGAIHVAKRGDLPVASMFFGAVMLLYYKIEIEAKKIKGRD